MAHIFAEGMVAGRAFIVLAAIVLGNWNPARVAGACLLFGIIDAFQYKMQIVNLVPQVPIAFWLMLPYLVTIAAVTITKGRRVPGELQRAWIGS